MTPTIFLVGGAVRDILLGITPKDRDYVVVGANHDWMISQGFERVGLDFPVYFHPETGDEYALARREKKVGTGYNGFETETNNVALEADCMRRDLTINSMAMDSDGNIIDYFGGQEDLKNGILRHVSIAFKEDPLRVVRLARFAARYNFKVAPETIKICKEIVKSGELETLDINRLWKEIRRAVHESYFPLFFQVLHDVGAFDSGRLKQLNSNISSKYNFFWDQTCCEFPTEVIIAQCFNVTHELGASNMEISLRKMLHDYVNHSFSDPVGFILNHRLMQKTEKTDLFFKWGEFKAYRLCGKFDDANMDRLKKIIDIMKTTDVQSVIESGLKGKELNLAIRNAHVENVMKRI